MSWNRNQKLGAVCLVLGGGLCFTLIGGIVGLPMAIVGAWLWKRGEAQNTDNAAAA